MNIGAISPSDYYIVTIHKGKMDIAPSQDRKAELSLLIQAIDELQRKGEVKTTEWIRGGQVA